DPVCSCTQGFTYPLRFDLSADRLARFEAALGDALAAAVHQHRLINDHGLVGRLVDAELHELACKLFARSCQILPFIEDDAVRAGRDRFGEQALEQALWRLD